MKIEISYKMFLAKRNRGKGIEVASMAKSK